MKRTLNLYLHFCFAVILIPFLLWGGNVEKALIIVYALWLIYKQDVIYLPAIFTISSYLSNAYPLYFFIMILVWINFRNFADLKLKNILIILFAAFPLILFQVISKSNGNINLLFLSLNQFQLYFALFLFFYGIILVKSFNKDVIKGISICLLLLYVVSEFLNYYFEVIPARLTFYIIPLLISFLVHKIFMREKRKSFFLITSIALIIAFSLRVDNLTFTLLLTALYSSVLVFTISFNIKKINYFLLGYPIIIIMFLMVFFAITNSISRSNSVVSNLSFSEINSIDAFQDKAASKMYGDRGTLWRSVFIKALIDKNYFPPTDYEDIDIETFDGRKVTFKFSSHNIYLEFLRVNGIIYFFLLSYVIIVIILKTGMVLKHRIFESNFRILIIVAFSNLLIGGITGIYVLLPTYAMLGMVLPGIAYGHYYLVSSKELNQFSVEKSK